VSGLTLDAGALIAFERADRKVVTIIARAFATQTRLSVPTGVIAQVWRNGRLQARLARLLGSKVIEVVPLDDLAARQAGQLCGIAGTNDVVDASVVICARARQHGVLTSDPKDLRRLDETLTLITV
jgi:hypothetical protein